MFRTDRQTGGVLSTGWLATPAPDVSPASSVLLLRARHDHAPRSTRSRWRLHQADRPGGRSPADRHPRVRVGSARWPSHHRSGSTRLGSASPSHLVRPGRGGGGSCGRAPCVESSRVLAFDRQPGAGPAVLRSPSRPGRRAKRSIRSGGRGGHRPSRDQSQRSGVQSTLRRHHRTFHRSSPAPVAGGGASPLHLRGDGPYAPSPRPPGRGSGSGMPPSIATGDHRAGGGRGWSPVGPPAGLPAGLQGGLPTLGVLSPSPRHRISHRPIAALESGVES